MPHLSYRSAHVNHHSSPDFNLSTALRQGAGEPTFSWRVPLPEGVLLGPLAFPT